MLIKPHRLPETIYGVPVTWDFIPRPGNKIIRELRESTSRFLLHSTEGLPKFTSESWDRFKLANPGFKNWTGAKQIQAIQKAVYANRLTYRHTWTADEEVRAFEGARRTLAASHAAPTATTGNWQIAQHRMIGQQGAALRGAANALAFIQVECSGNTEGRKGVWLFTDATLVPTVALLAYCSANYDIPLRVPGDWPDDMHDCPLPWASDKNVRRLSNVWETQKGVFMHLEADENTHYDCALLQRTLVIEAARQVIAGMSPADAVANIRGVGRIPAVKPIDRSVAALIYKVKAGDGLWQIAKDHKISFALLLQLNGLKPDSVIHPDQELKIAA